MKIKAADITRALDSRGSLTTVIVVMIVSVMYALRQCLSEESLSGNRGLFFASVNEWLASPMTSAWVNLVLITAVVVLMIYINKAYTVPRNITLLYAIFFVVLQTATPAITTQLYTGTVLLVLVSFSMTIMFGLFGRPKRQSSVFLVFFLLSVAISVQYDYAVYIPVFFVACAQMRIMNLRTVLAAILGIITPWWLLLGFGIIGPEDFRMPSICHVDFLRDGEAAISVLCVATTAIFAIAAYGSSLLKIMSYNARTRACNGMLTLITLMTIIAMVVDFSNYLTYLPLLNFCTAFFLSHFFVIRNTVRSWIIIITIVTIYYTFYIWRIVV